jgi:hypothetical protein
LGAAAGGATPIGRICANAGPAVIAASAVNPKSALARRFVSTVNLFISNDNPASPKLHTWLAARPPVAMTPQWPSIGLRSIFANQSLSEAG